MGSGVLKKIKLMIGWIVRHNYINFTTDTLAKGMLPDANRICVGVREASACVGVVCS